MLRVAFLAYHDTPFPRLDQPGMIHLTSAFGPSPLLSVCSIPSSGLKKPTLLIAQGSVDRFSVFSEEEISERISCCSVHVPIYHPIDSCLAKEKVFSWVVRDPHRDDFAWEKFLPPFYEVEKYPLSASTSTNDLLISSLEVTGPQHWRTRKGLLKTCWKYSNYFSPIEKNRRLAFEGETSLWVVMLTDSRFSSVERGRRSAFEGEKNSSIAWIVDLCFS